MEDFIESAVWVRFQIFGEEEIKEGFSGETVGVVAIGHDSAVDATPAEALDLVMSE
jgi:hypothetical protein